MNTVQTIMGVQLFRIAAELRERGGSGWITRGDLARIAKITPKHAGMVLRAAKEKALVKNKGIWWYPAHEDSFAVTSPRYRVDFDRIVKPKVYNVFGNQ